MVGGSSERNLALGLNLKRETEHEKSQRSYLGVKRPN
jgi:hypothetical protein